MSEKHCLAIRWGAFGDMLYALPTLELLKKDYGYLHLETGQRGEILFRHHPAFDRISVFDVGKYNPKDHQTIAKIRWSTLEHAFRWDKVVNFWRCLEASAIAEEWQEDFFKTREYRRQRFGPINFYDTHLAKAGYQVGTLQNCGTFYFDQETIYWMNRWRDQNDGFFNVAFSLSGSTGQKVPMGMKELAAEIIANFPKTRIYLLGNKEGQNLEFSFGEKNVVQACGQWGYMQSMALVKMADYVVGPETSLLVAAGMFGVPKSMICTSCGVSQANQYHKNDFSVQSAVDCSPCHRAIYNYEGKASERFCNRTETFLGNIPHCNFWDVGPQRKKILEGVERAFKMCGLRREIEKRSPGPGFGSLPELRAPVVSGADRGEEVRPGVPGEIQSVRADGVGDGDLTVPVGVIAPSPPGFVKDSRLRDRKRVVCPE